MEGGLRGRENCWKVGDKSREGEEVWKKTEARGEGQGGRTLDAPGSLGGGPEKS